MREVNINGVGFQTRGNPKRTGPGIEDQADLREHQAGRMTPFIGMKAARSEEFESHTEWLRKHGP